MDPRYLTREFKEFLRLLNSNEVDYLVIGGHAVAFHGYPRATSDLDIWIEPSATTAPKVALALQQFGFPAEEIDPNAFHMKGLVFRIGLPPNQIELLTGIDGIEFRNCFPSRVAAELDGISVCFIDLKNLKANKRANGRHKDLADLDELP